LPAEWNLPAGVIIAAGVLFLVVLARGATYAGIRHALPVLVLLSIFAGFFASMAVASHSRRLQVVAALAFALAMVSALPVMRPWEYFNELVGTQNAYKLFSDEGVDLDQRTKELAAYYNRVLKPAGELPLVYYFCSQEELRGRDVDFPGRDMKRDLKLLIQPEKSGTFLVGRIALIPSPFWDRPALRAATPIARFGNLFVYHGTLSLPADVGAFYYFDGIEKLYADKPDVVAAEKQLQLSVDADPSPFFAHIELANLMLKRGARAEALQEYSRALQYAPADPQVRQPIEVQIQRVKNLTGEIPALRNPFME
jgi:hypothetical protein